jgi:hypothetical protein
MISCYPYKLSDGTWHVVRTTVTVAFEHPVHGTFYAEADGRIATKGKNEHVFETRQEADRWFLDLLLEKRHEASAALTAQIEELEKRVATAEAVG